MLFELGDKGSVYDVFVCSDHSRLSSTQFLLDHQDLGGLEAVIEHYCELSVIITHLGCGSVVCLDNNTQWLHKLHVLILFYYCLLFVVFEEQRTHPTTNNFHVMTMPSTPRHLRAQCSLQRERVWPCTVT